MDTCLGRSATRAARQGERRRTIIPGDPEEISVSVEVEMISIEAKRQFKLFRDPFIDDIQKDAD
ncbi:MAG: hypothetical protein ACD_75C01376G0001, partial [uncultured bacterium]